MRNGELRSHDGPEWESRLGLGFEGMGINFW
jgi:hypothetical protein